MHLWIMALGSKTVSGIVVRDRRLVNQLLINGVPTSLATPMARMGSAVF